MRESRIACAGLCALFLVAVGLICGCSTSQVKAHDNHTDVAQPSRITPFMVVSADDLIDIAEVLRNEDSHLAILSINVGVENVEVMTGTLYKAPRDTDTTMGEGVKFVLKRRDGKWTIIDKKAWTA